MTEPDIARSLFSGKGSKPASSRRRKAADADAPTDDTETPALETASGIDAAMIEALEAQVADLTQALKQANDDAIAPKDHQKVVADLEKATQKIEELTYRLDLSQKSEQKLKTDVKALETERDQLQKQLQEVAKPAPPPASLQHQNPKHTQPMAIRRPVFPHPVDDDQDMPSFMLD
ncbi:MAG: hypothetical protein HC818_00290 [Synechococcaceae cyanobacterium RM1_1_27]|nr:hypothetical protein [Synechococcaceae cyanobacterium SM2_3_2]NJO85338.1 hypothetical protein [Synechococcaceae cyanobacterium RM1_1_27]